MLKPKVKEYGQLRSVLGKTPLKVSGIVAVNREWPLHCLQRGYEVHALAAKHVQAGTRNDIVENTQGESPTSSTSVDLVV